MEARTRDIGTDGLWRVLLPATRVLVGAELVMLLLHHGGERHQTFIMTVSFFRRVRYKKLIVLKALLARIRTMARTKQVDVPRKPNPFQKKEKEEKEKEKHYHHPERVLKRVQSLVSSGLGQLWDTEIDAFGEGTGACGSDGTSRNDVIGLIMERLEAAVMGDTDVVVSPGPKPKKDNGVHPPWLDEHYENLTISELKAIAKELDVKATGKKADLIKAIMGAPLSEFKKTRMEEWGSSSEVDVAEQISRITEEWFSLDEESYDQAMAKDEDCDHYEEMEEEPDGYIEDEE